MKGLLYPGLVIFLIRILLYLSFPPKNITPQGPLFYMYHCTVFFRTKKRCAL